MKKLSYQERADLTQNKIAKKLFNIINNKKTNLAFSADVTSSEQLIFLAEKLGSEICILKTHIDIVGDFTQDLTKKLKILAKQYEFLIFEDRKFADIGNTVKLQYHSGIYQIASWADIINAHSFPGSGIIRALDTSGLLLLANMSSEGCLADQNYIDKTIKMANNFPQTVFGFIANKKISSDPRHIHMTPGVRFIEKNDDLGQQYITPEIAIKQQNTDVIIVGRGILQAEDQLIEAVRYRRAGWEAYLGS